MKLDLHRVAGIGEAAQLLDAVAAGAPVPAWCAEPQATGEGLATLSCPRRDPRHRAINADARLRDRRLNNGSMERLIDRAREIRALLLEISKVGRDEDRSHAASDRRKAPEVTK